MNKTMMNHRGHGERREKILLSVYPLRSLWLIALLFAACTPAQTPPILDATPGAAVVVTDDTYRNDLFSVRYPAGWRVITSQAGDPPTVTFVAPDNCALIIVSADATVEAPVSPACDEPDVQSAARNITLGSTRLTVVGSAPAAQWDVFLARLDQVAASVEAAV